MTEERFFKDSRLPFIEGRYSRSRGSFKTHMHHAFSLGAVDRGVVEYRVADRLARLEPGSLAVINPEILHSCNPVEGSERSYFMLYLAADWCTKVQQVLWQTETFVPVNIIRIGDNHLYTAYCQAMHVLFSPEHHLQEKEQLLVDLLISIFNGFCDPQQNPPQPSDNIEGLKELLRLDLRKDLTLDSLAGSLGENPYTLLRRFKAVTGVTPHAYRMNCRIEQARVLLQRGMDIGETALECGFFDQSHFHRHFKAMTTVTPRQYQLNFIQ